MKLVVLSVLLLIASVSAEEESVEVLSQKPERINWLPVWDSDQQAVDAIKISRTQISSVYPNPALPLFPLKPQTNLGVCDAPNGLGMSNLFKLAKELLPRERIRSIMYSAAADPQVQALKKLIKTPEYRQRTANLSQSREYRGFGSFACYKMNCDLRLYNDFVKNLLQIPESLELPTKDVEVYRGRPGWHGILADIQDALPRQQLRGLFERLLATDWYLIRAVQTAQSYEFEAVFKLVQQNEDYKYLKRALAKVGFSVEELKKLVYIALGWRKEVVDATGDLLTQI